MVAAPLRSLSPVAYPQRQNRAITQAMCTGEAAQYGNRTGTRTGQQL